MTLMKKQIGDKMNPLSINELKEDLSLRYERLNLRNVMILVKKGRYSLCITKENVDTAENWVITHHNIGPRWSKVNKMKISVITVRSQTISSLTASNC